MLADELTMLVDELLMASGRSYQQNRVVVCKTQGLTQHRDSPICGGKSEEHTVGGKESTIGLIDLIDRPKEL